MSTTSQNDDWSAEDEELQHHVPLPVELPLTENIADEALDLKTQILRFLATGVLSAIVDQGLNLLLHFVFGVGVTLAKAIGFILGTTTAYLINRRWTFNAAPSRARFMAVVALYAATFAVQVGIYTWLYNVFSDGFWYSNIAFVVAQGTATVINFVVQRVVIFKIR
nr:GtrA family protein [Rhodococcus sp. (in: high G+C Gram-positive bacteria)]